MNSFGIIYTPAVETTCPICNKLFMIAAPDSYVYKVKDYNNRTKYLCSWGCLRTWENQNKNKSQEAKKKRIQRQMMGKM